MTEGDGGVYTNTEYNYMTGGVTVESTPIQSKVT